MADKAIMSLLMAKMTLQVWEGIEQERHNGDLSADEAKAQLALRLFAVETELRFNKELRKGGITDKWRDGDIKGLLEETVRGIRAVNIMAIVPVATTLEIWNVLNYMLEHASKGPHEHYEMARPLGLVEQYMYRLIHEREPSSTHTRYFDETAEMVKDLMETTNTVARQKFLDTLWETTADFAREAKRHNIMGLRGENVSGWKFILSGGGRLVRGTFGDIRGTLFSDPDAPNYACS